MDYTYFFYYFQVVRKLFQKNRIYLDYAAATPIDGQVIKAMRKIESSSWGNPSSLHDEGEKAKNILENSRKEIAHVLHCRADEIYFTSGGTEAANIAVVGVLKNKTNAHVICSSIEHPAVLEAVKNSGAEVSLVSPDENGIINPKSIEKELRRETVLVCLMHANNEIGTLQPVREVSKLIRSSQIKFNHSNRPVLLVDACQSVLYEDVSVERLGADILFIDGIKMYGPRGAGVLVIKNGIKVSPTVFGGSQEKGLRSGTENVVGAAGLAEALKIAVQMRDDD